MSSTPAVAVATEKPEAQEEYVNEKEEMIDEKSALLSADAEEEVPLDVQNAVALEELVDKITTAFPVGNSPNAPLEAPLPLKMPGRNNIVTRLRYALISLNLFIPIFLESTQIISTAPYMSIAALVFAVLGSLQLHRQIKKAEKEDYAMGLISAVTQNAQVVEAVNSKNKKVMRQLRMEIISAWVGAGSWIVACLLWVAVVVVSPRVQERHLAVVGCSAVEAAMCITLGVLMTRYRKMALAEMTVEN